MSQWRPGLKLLRRKGSAASCAVCAGAGASVACVLSVALVADRLDAGLKASGRDFIGADRVLRSATRRRPPGWRRRSRRGC